MILNTALTFHAVLRTVLLEYIVLLSSEFMIGVYQCCTYSFMPSKHKNTLKDQGIRITASGLRASFVFLPVAMLIYRTGAQNSLQPVTFISFIPID